MMIGHEKESDKIDVSIEKCADAPTTRLPIDSQQNSRQGTKTGLLSLIETRKYDSKSLFWGISKININKCPFYLKK